MYSKPWDNGNLKVKNGKYLTNGETPFFWLGDTAWMLFQRLNKEEAEIFLEDRRLKDFNVIMAVLINGISSCGKVSNQCVEKNDVLDVICKENEEYWQHIDFIIEKAESLGLYMALLPCWGSIVKNKYLNLENADAYLKFITDRYGKKKNVIWILGGDIRGNDHFALWDKMGKYLKAATPDKLVGFHPFGRTSSSYWFHECDWLDFNMFQSGHRRTDQRDLTPKPTSDLFDNAISGEPWHGEDNWRYVIADCSKTPAKPTMDGEPSYEQIPHGLHDSSQPRWEAQHVRRYAYWSVLSGACGHVYGHNSIMQFYGKSFAPAYGAIDTWEEALSAEGARSMTVLKKIMTENNFTNGRPMNEIIDDAGEYDDRILAFGTSDAIIIYNYSGREFSLSYNNALYRCMWVNAETGAYTYIGIRRLDKTLFKPPLRKGHSDWILILRPVLS